MGRTTLQGRLHARRQRNDRCYRLRGARLGHSLRKGRTTRRSHPLRIQGTNEMSQAPNSADAENHGLAPGGIQALDAALHVLRALRSFDGPASLSEIARETGMPPSKVHRYLASF